MSHLTLKPEHRQLICDLAQQTYPEECCGLLLGTLEDGGKRVVEVVPTENSWDGSVAESFAQISERRAASKQRSFSIAPATLFAVQKEARDRGLGIIGIYHSHPDHSATPSEFDRAIAWPEYSYIIVSVLQGQVGEFLSWTLDDDRHFYPETVLQVP